MPPSKPPGCGSSAWRVSLTVSLDPPRQEGRGRGRLLAPERAWWAWKRAQPRSAVPARALFVFIGALPHTEWLEGQLATDDAGFLLTGRDVQDGALGEHSGDPPFFLETSRPGIFAAGDVRSGSIKRVASAVGEGMAVRLVHDRLAAL